VHERGRLLELEARGHDPVGAQVEGAHLGALGQARGLDRGEQAVERADGLLDLGAPHAGRPAPLGGDETLGAQAAQRLAHRVAADLVLRNEGVLAGEDRVELALAQSSPQIVLNL
jgi:hypothetical protein